MRKLCDQVLPISLEEARKLLHEELGCISPHLEGEAVAAASLGQVYKLKIEGQEYAMKIQRPGLADALAVDIVVLMKIAAFSGRVSAWFCVSTMDHVAVVRNWAQTLWYELDYELEARNMEYMRGRLIPRVSGLVIPKVIPHLSSLRVLTTEWVNGTGLTRALDSLTARHIAIGVDAFATMVLDIGLVHADP